MSDAVVVDAAPAKLNLCLKVLGKRTDGYHELFSWFAFASLVDQVTARPADRLSLEISGPFSGPLDGPPEGNLVVRAARLLHQAAQLPAGQWASLTLDKQIPVAAGLGGGSADAAAALRGLNRLWALDWSIETLATLAEPLGADVPACVRGKAHLACGRGETFVADAPVPSLPMLLVNPLRPLPTAAVFAQVGDIGPIEMPGQTNWSLQAAKALGNDLTPAALRLMPDIADVLTLLDGCEGLCWAQLCGSGPTVGAIFTSPLGRNAAIARIRRQFPAYWYASCQLLA
jgi:4-diphosphocytidyl-2-C-methyl-D-erythritol kinase